MCCTKRRPREKTADVRLWQSSLPWIYNNKAAEGKCHPRTIPDGPAWMNIFFFYFHSGQEKEGKETSNALTLKPCQIGGPASWRVIRRWHWGGSDMLRYFRNKKIFLVAKRSGKWNDSPQQLGTCSSSTKKEMRWGHGVHLWREGRVGLTAVSSGRQQGFRNASLSPLCLIIWMTSQYMTQRHLYEGWQGY